MLGYRANRAYNVANVQSLSVKSSHYLQFVSWKVWPVAINLALLVEQLSCSLLTVQKDNRFP